MYVIRLLSMSLIAAIVVVPGGSVVEGQASTVLGRFEMGRLQGLVNVRDLGGEFDVRVIVASVAGQGAIGDGRTASPLTGEDLERENLQLWALLPSAGVLTLKQRDPPRGTGSGGRVDLNVRFVFDGSERPVAVVLMIGDRFQVFPVPARTP